MAYQLGDPSQLPVGPQPDPAVPQLQPPQMSAPNVISAQPLYPNQTPQGALASTPAQAVSDYLVNREKLKNAQDPYVSTPEGGKLDEQGAQEHAQANADAATQKLSDKKKIEDTVKVGSDKWDTEHQTTKDRMDAFWKKSLEAGKDPTNEFYKDSPLGAVGGRIASAFAAFASGMGAGLTGAKQGNPFLDYLNQRIRENAQAHQEQLEDLYKTAVESGKIENSTENHNAFILHGMEHAITMGEEATKYHLASIMDNSNSRVIHALGEKTVLDLEQEQNDRKAQYGQNLEKQAADVLAQQKAEQKAVREYVAKAREGYNGAVADGTMTNEEANVAAAKQASMLGGFNRSSIAPIMDASGIKTDPKTGEWVFPKAPESTSTTSPGGEGHFDENGNYIPPSTNASGQKIGKKEQDKMVEEAPKRTVIVDGKPALAVNEKAAEKWQAYSEAEPEAKRLTEQLNKAWTSGDAGSYTQARNALIELAPKLYGYTRGPSNAQAEGSSADDIERARGTVGGQIPVFEGHGLVPQSTQSWVNNHPLSTNSGTGQSINMLKGWGNQLENIGEDMRKNTFKHLPETKTPEGSKEETKPTIRFTPSPKEKEPEEKPYVQPARGWAPGMPIPNDAGK